MALDPTVVKSLAWAFYDRGTRELSTPEGLAPVRSNAISDFIDGLVARGVARIERGANGAPSLRYDDPQVFDLIDQGLSEILEPAPRAVITGVRLYGDWPGSEWKMLLENVPCALDPKTRELVALSAADLEAATIRFANLGRAVTIEDANLQFLSREITANQGRLYAPDQNGREYTAVMPRRDSAANVLASLRSARLPDPEKVVKLYDVLKDSPTLRSAVLPGVDVLELAEHLHGVDRATFRDLVVRTNETRLANSRNRSERALIAGQDSTYESRTGSPVDVNAYLESFDNRRSRYGSSSSTAQKTFGEQMAARASDEVRRGRRGEGAAAGSIEELIERDRAALEAQIQTARDRGDAESLLYRERLNVERLVGAPNAHAWVASIMRVSPFNAVVADQVGRYSIVPFDSVKAHCIGVKNHNADNWQSGSPNELTVKAWRNLSAPITISAERGENGAYAGLRVYGENPKTLRTANIRVETQKAEAAANNVFLSQEELALQAHYNEVAEDMAATLEYGAMVAARTFDLPVPPPRFGPEQLMESIVAQNGQDFETLSVTYPGPTLATGKYSVAQFVEGAVQGHYVDAIGFIPQLGEELEISYPANSDRLWCNVVRNAVDAQIAEMHAKVQAPLSRALRSAQIANESQAAIDRAAELFPDLTFSVLSLDEQEQGKARSLRAPVLHATPTIGFVPDVDNRVVLTFDPSVTGRIVERGDEAVILIGGGQSTRLIDVERTQERAINELTAARLTALDVTTLGAIDKVGMDILVETLDCRKNDLLPLSQANVPPGSLLTLTATTNHHVYMTIPLADNYIGYIRYPVWDEYGKCTTLASELQSVGYARTPYPGEKAQLQPLLRSERDELKLPLITAPNVTIRDARIPQVLVLNSETGAERAATRPFSIEAEVVAQTLRPQDLDVHVVGLDLSSAAEETIRTIIVLDDTQTNTRDLAEIAVGSTVKLAGANRDLSVTVLQSAVEKAEMNRAVFQLEREFAENQRTAERNVTPLGGR